MMKASLTKIIEKQLREIKPENEQAERQFRDLFAKNKRLFESTLIKSKPKCFAEVLNTLLDNCYSHIPTQDDVDRATKYFRDTNTSKANDLCFNYGEFAEYACRFNRKDITDEERLYCFISLDKCYNKCWKLIEEFNRENKMQIEVPKGYA